MVSDDGWPEHAAKLLGGEAWPDGKDWRCMRCGYVYDDGGRAEAGFTGHAGDCVVRALAIATGEDYRAVYDDLYARNRAALPKGSKAKASPRDGGTPRKVYDAWLAERGWTWKPTMHIGTGCTVHLRAEDLPGGDVIVRLSKHLAADIDGVLHDTGDCSRDGTRCVYGYWTRT